MQNRKHFSMPRITAKPVLITGFDSYPDLPAITAGIKSGLIWLVSRDINGKNVQVIFVQPIAAEDFVDKYKEAGFELEYSGPLKVDWAPDKTPAPISDVVATERFHRGTTRMMGISMPLRSKGRGIEPEDIIKLNSHIPDPRGGVLRMAKQKIDSAEDGTAREIIKIEFDSISSCLSARAKIDSLANNKFAGCTLLRLADPCGTLTANTRTDNKAAIAVAPLITLADTEPSVAEMAGRMSRSIPQEPSSQMARSAPTAITQDLMEFSSDEEKDSKANVAKSEPAQTPLAEMDDLEPLLAAVSVKEESGQASRPALSSMAAQPASVGVPKPAKSSKPYGVGLGASRWSS